MKSKGDSRDQPWTTIRLLEWTRGYFDSKGIEDARLEAELLLAHVLKVDRMRLYTGHGRVVGDPELSAFRDLVRRRAGHVPTQYLLGESHFRNLTLAVTPAVLIPRPETEILVDEALDLLRPAGPPAWAFERGEFVDHRDESGGGDQPELIPTSEARPAPASPRVLDLCTGSGCIALAVASECPGARVVATDVSAEALEVARGNAERAGVADRVTFLAGDLFAALEALPDAERRFDLVTANPPYVREADLPTLMPEVRDHEPHASLVAGPTGLEVIDRIVSAAPRHLEAGGALLMEIGYDQAGAVRQRVGDSAEFHLVGIRKDLGGHERVVHLRRT